MQRNRAKAEVVSKEGDKGRDALRDEGGRLCRGTRLRLNSEDEGGSEDPTKRDCNLVYKFVLGRVD